MSSRHGSADKPAIDLAEYGMAPDGSRASTERRLFMQLQVFGGCLDSAPVVEHVRASGIEAVVYHDVINPRNIGLLTMAEDPSALVTEVRPVTNSGPMTALEPLPHFAMTGRSYASGYEPNLEDWLLDKPRRTTRNPSWPWAVWYPLRRTGAFSALPEDEQKSILREHGGIGRQYGQQDLAHDVRLACHGIDTNDNEFLIGLVGKELHPLSHLVQRMRKTRQTSEFIQAMGPFFVGHTAWQAPVD